MTTQMIVCSNKKSVNYEGLGIRSKKNARWSNVTNIKFNVGDTLSINNAVINLRGSTSDQTVEILGENSPKLADSKVGLKFIPYLNDNARENTVALPFTGGTTTVNPTSSNPITYNEDNYPHLDNLHNMKFVPPTVSKDNDQNMAPYNSNEMDCTDMFNFSYDNNDPENGDKIFSPRYKNVRTLYTKSGTRRSVFGEKYILLDESYLGPYRKTNIGDGNEFWSGEDDCKPMEMSIKIDIGPTYASPSTIANEIDDALHTTNIYGENNIDPVGYQNRNQPVKLPSITGPLLKNKIVNGENKENENENGGRQRLYGNMAVANLNDWQGLHWMMRCFIEFEGYISFNDDSGGYSFNRPVYLLPRSYMVLNDKDDKNVDRAYYPRASYRMNYKFTKWDDDDGDYTQDGSLVFYYTTLPENFLIITNISYSDDQLRLLSKYRSVKEIYDGIFDEQNDIDSDTEQLRMHLDVGVSQQGVEDTTKAKYMYQMSQGNVNIGDIPDIGIKVDPTAYAYSFPYVPFKDAVGDDYVEWSSNRSDIPDQGYIQNIRYNEDLQNYAYRGSIESIQQDVPQRFQNNKAGNASMAVKSRYISNWRDICKTSNTPNDVRDLDVLYEGNGYYADEHLDLTSDDSLSKKYNVGAYPVKMRSNKAYPFYFDLTDSYWIGEMNNLDTAVQNVKYSFLYKITAGTGDQATYGGYDFNIWDGDSWGKDNDMFIYTAHNKDVSPDRDPLDGLTFGDDNEYNLDDMNTDGATWIIFDNANDKRFAAIIQDSDQDNSIHIKMYYCMPGFQTLYGSYKNFSPIGELPLEISGTYHELQVTDMFIMSDDPDDPHYWENEHTVTGTGEPTGINSKPISKVQNDSNPERTVCAFLLYRDSATQQNDGSWDISTDFALPSMHQAQFCCSASFLDHEALWMLNGTMFSNQSNPDSQTERNTINYISIGSNNPTFAFNNDVARCSFSNLHNPMTLGLRDMPYDESTSEYDMTNIGKMVIKINDDKITRGWLFNMLDTYSSDGNGSFSGFGEYDVNYGLNYADGGLFIYGIYGQNINDNRNDIDTMTEYTQDNWEGSLLYKLGFEYTDLIKTFGRQDRLYDYSKLKNTNIDRYDILKPVSTNPQIDISMATSLAVMDYSNTSSAGVGEPLFSRAVGSMQDVNIDASQSENLYASNEPIKNNEGFYLVYCNLINSGYIQNESTYSIIGNIMKNYQAGDYIYSFQNPPMTINFADTITQIDIEIRNANGEVVSLDDDNSIIFKHDKNINALQDIPNNKKIKNKK